MTARQPLDPAAVAADDAAIETLRGGSGRPGGSGDVALLLVQELLRDVSSEAPRPATALRLVGSAPAPARLLRRGALVAALAAGVLSVGGAAAATTLAPEGSGLRGVGDVVRSAAAAVVAAVAPAVPAEPSAPEQLAVASPHASAGATAMTPPGGAPAPARQATAEQTVVALLDSAARQLAAGRSAPADALLDRAERRLSEVPPAAAPRLRTRLDALRSAVGATAPGPRPGDTGPGASPGQAPDPGSGASPGRSDGQDEASGAPSRGRGPAAGRPATGDGRALDEPAAATAPEAPSR